MTAEARLRMSKCFSSLVEELRGESDRGSVVLAAAWIDDQLTCLIKSFLCTPLNEQERLLKIGGPVGDFGTKIELAYRLGLIREETYRSLGLFRRLRNDFAHLSSPLTFQTPAVKDRVLDIFRLNEQMLEAIWETAREIDSAKSVLSDVGPGESKITSLWRTLGVRYVFDLSAAMTASGLLLAVSQVEQLQVLE
ncbi:hypothetical protein XarbCFBP8147_17570 [Xanthomonas arboricola]|nr:hypothetical protein XarbCFBP8147_17570 [Xanthomonas arboricola]